MAQVVAFSNVWSFVKATVPLIEADLSVSVDDSAREELVNRMLPHEETVSQDLASGKMSLMELQGILLSVIQKAASINPGKPIDRSAISKAIESECRYLGWC